MGQIHGRVRQYGSNIYSADDREARDCPSGIPKAAAGRIGFEASQVVERTT